MRKPPLCPITLLSVTLLLPLGCGTMSAARRAYEQGDYLKAERLASERVEDHPDDDEARKLRASARERALERLVADERAARARGDGEAALATLTRLLHRRRTWGVSLPDESALPAALEAARSHVRGRLTPLLQRGRALEAEAQLERRRSLLAEPELAPLGEELRGEVRQGGERACAGLRAGATADEPYWSWLVDRYCERLGVAAGTGLARPSLPGLLGAVTFHGAVEGLSAGEQAELQARLGDAVRRTPWYAPSGRPTAASVSGRHRVAFSTRQVNRVHHWSQSVAYQDRQMYTETTRVPYTAYETYTVQVPHTTYQSYSYSCGYGNYRSTCTGSRPTTQYRSETRSRMVTKYRTNFETKWRNVTKYRMEPRTTPYVVDEHLGQYDTHLALALDVGGAPVVARIDATDQRTRETSQHVPLGAKLAGEPLPPARDWLDRHTAALHANLVWQLGRAWWDRQCRGDSHSREQAARCLYGAADPPAPARAALQAVLGEDASHLVSALSAQRSR
jgi:hypothetical protein